MSRSVRLSVSGNSECERKYEVECERKCECEGEGERVGVRRCKSF